MAENYDGFQVFRKDEHALMPVFPCRASYREAVEDKLRIKAADKFGIYEIHGIINRNNTK